MILAGLDNNRSIDEYESDRSSSSSGGGNNGGTLDSEDGAAVRLCSFKIHLDVSRLCVPDFQNMWRKKMCVI